jgi:hypothetical protein
VSIKPDENFLSPGARGSLCSLDRPLVPHNEMTFLAPLWVGLGVAAHTELGSGEGVLAAEYHGDCSDRKNDAKKQDTTRPAQVFLEPPFHDDHPQ